MDAGVVSLLLELLKNKGFQALHHEVSLGRTSLSDLRTEEMPLGLSTEQVWEILNALRRHIYSSGEVLEAKHDPRSWYVMTGEMTQLIASIDTASKPGSHLSNELPRWDTTRLFLQPLVNDFMTALRKDGYPVEYEIVRALLLNEMEPKEDTERLVANTLLVITNLDDYVGHNLDSAILSDILKRITIGCSTESCHCLANIQQENTADIVLATIYKACNDTALTPENITTIPYFSWTYRPFGEYSCLMELVIRRLSFRKKGRPVLSLIPYSHTHQTVVDKAMAPGIEAGIHTSEGIDFTEWIVKLLSAVKQDIEALENALERAQERGERLLDGIRPDRDINTRQRKILARALRRPKAEFTISHHAKHFGIVKASARSDLYQLVDIGFLRKEKRGKEMLFIPASDLPLLLARHALHLQT